MSLRQGLEALYTFDSDHIDQAAGVAKDFSGKERHATASGGPTYEKSSPVGEAVGFDGTDDKFNLGTPLAAGNEQTLSVLVKINSFPSSGSERLFENGWPTDGIVIYVNDTSSIITGAVDGSGNLVSAGTSINTDVWYLVTNRLTGENVQNIIDGDLRKQDTLTTHTQGTANAIIGGKNFPINADIAWMGRWNRTLSDAEIKQLNRMTDRMVSKL